jgi:hypothetical protein
VDPTGAATQFLRPIKHVLASETEPWLRSPASDSQAPVTIDESTPAALAWGSQHCSEHHPLRVYETLVVPGQRVIVAGRPRCEPNGTLSFGGANAMLLCTCDDAELERMRKAMVSVHVQVAVIGAVLAAVGVLVAVVFAG